MEIKILGTGCAKCDMMESVAREAVSTLGLDATVEHVRDFGEIMSYGVMATPALVVDGEVRLAGRVPSAAAMAKVLSGARDAHAGQGGCGCGGGCC